MQPPSLEAVSRELGALVRQLKALHGEATRDAGLRLELPAFGALLQLELHGAVRPSVLADLLGVDLSTASRQLTALERDGRVVRRRDPLDSRAQLVELSDHGRDALARVRAARVAAMAERLPSWTEPELAAFAAELARFTADLAAPALATTR